MQILYCNKTFQCCFLITGCLCFKMHFKPHEIYFLFNMNLKLKGTLLRYEH